MSEQVSRGTRGQVLIVDDTLANLRLLTDMLREQGYKVRGAPNGEIALNATRSSRPDLILLDINMPGLNGYEVCRALKADESTRDIPVIFLSALDEPLDKVKAFEVGGVDYISKPFQLEEVLVRVDNQLKLEQLQTELRQARDQADAASRAKSAFLANMSHEIRTPMNAILGYAQILIADEELSEKQRRAVETIETSGGHLLALINDVLDLSKIEAGREELHQVDFDLSRLAQELDAVFRMRCQQKGLAWKMEVDLVEARVRGDAQKLRQVLINLLGNAVKFTGEGTVHLLVGGGVDRRFRFAVADTGPGIPPERQQAIFEPFQQEETGLLLGGTGLGLAIAHRHVALMGGELQLESAVGTGARFSFTLELDPARGEIDEESQWARVRRLVPGTTVEALVVDDVDTNREILAQMLEGLGVRVRLAGGGEEALAQVQAQAPDIVFLDIRMPGMDGTEVLGQLQQRYEWEALKTVAISASVLEHQRRSYLEAGFDDFVGKPFRRERLCACLAELLDVEFEYAEQKSAATEEAPEPLPEDLVLPEPLLANLKEAVRIHNMTRLREQLDLLEEAGDGGRRLAAHLRPLSRRYDLKGIGAVLEGIGCG